MRKWITITAVLVLFVFIFSDASYSGESSRSPQFVSPFESVKNSGRNQQNSASGARSNFYNNYKYLVDRMGNCRLNIDEKRYLARGFLARYPKGSNDLVITDSQYAPDVSFFVTLTGSGKSIDVMNNEIINFFHMKYNPNAKRAGVTTNQNVSKKNKLPVQKKVPEQKKATEKTIDELIKEYVQ